MSDTAHALSDQLHRTAADLSTVIGEPSEPWLFSGSSHTSEAFRRAYLRSPSPVEGLLSILTYFFEWPFPHRLNRIMLFERFLRGPSKKPGSMTNAARHPVNLFNQVFR